MEKRICLNIPLGYRVIDKTEYIKAWQAEKYLLSRRARRYTKAVRRGDDAALIRDILSNISWRTSWQFKKNGI